MPRESQQAKKKRAAEIMAVLRKSHPDAKCALNHRTPLQLLVATILSAQCTDVRVNIVTRDLFAKYKTTLDYADAPQEVLQEEIRSTGFFRNKAKSIRQAAQKIVTDFDGKVPKTMADLLGLAGVARKTANVVLSNAFGKNEGIVVDTHVSRLAQRLKLSANTGAEKIERDLMVIMPQGQWGDFSHLLIFHGRRCCTARKPHCPECSISRLCPSAFTLDGTKNSGRKQPQPTKPASATR